MSDQSDREVIGDEYGVWSVDAEDQLQPEDTLDGTGDVLDAGYIAADHAVGSLAHGVTASEQAGEETIAQRLRQEEPDPYSTFDPDQADDSGDDLDGAGTPTRVGRIIAPDEGGYTDDEATMIAREGRATSWDSPEEAAMHYVSDDFNDTY